MGTRKRICIAMVFSVAALSAPFLYGQQPDSLSLMPMPSHLTQGDGQLKIDSSFSVALEGYKEERLEAARQRFLKTRARRLLP